MIKWYEPITVAEWLKRTLSIFNLGLFLLMAFFLFSEFRFDWGERIIGNYLATTNASRPETGVAWKTGNKAERAHTNLKAMVDERQNTARSAQEAHSFPELAAAVLPGQWTRFDIDRFKKLYLELPTDLAAELIAPSELVWLLSGPGVMRIFCQGTAKGLEIYLLDSSNSVVRQINLDHSFLSGLGKSEAPFMGTLEEIPGFAGRIFPSEKFFKALLSLPREMIPDLITTPGRLLEQGGKIVRAGIGNEAKSGYIRLGFEFQENGETKIIFLRGREWAIWQLTTNLAQGEE